MPNRTVKNKGLWKIVSNMYKEWFIILKGCRRTFTFHCHFHLKQRFTSENYWNESHFIKKIIKTKELEIDCFESGGAFYLFPSIKRFNMSSRDFCLKLLHEHNVLVVPGTAFGDSGEGSIRISYATSMERIKQFVEVLRKISA